MSKKITENIFRYNAIFEPCEEGGFTVTVPKLPGVVTEGDTFEEALEQARNAVAGHLQILTEAGEEIPEADQNSFIAPVDINLSKNKIAIA